MKNKIDNLINRQINLILEVGKDELLPAEYLMFILQNYDTITKFNTKPNFNETDKSVVDSLSILVSRLK